MEIQSWDWIYMTHTQGGRRNQLHLDSGFEGDCSTGFDEWLPLQQTSGCCTVRQQANSHWTVLAGHTHRFALQLTTARDSSLHLVVSIHRKLVQQSPIKPTFQILDVNFCFLRLGITQIWYIGQDIWWCARLGEQWAWETLINLSIGQDV